MSCGCGTDTVDDQAHSRQDTKTDKPPSKKVTVSLGSEDEDRIDAIDEKLPEVYYVIIGRGPQAVINHSTLRQSEWGKKRLAKLPVLHVGFPNPWPKYLEHGLGQPNHLLSLPGFESENQPSGADSNKTLDGGLNSQHFGKCIDDQFKHLKETHKDVKVSDCWVAWIQSKNGKEDPYKDQTEAIKEEEGGEDVLKVVSSRLTGEKTWPDFKDHDTTYRLCLYDPKKKEADVIYAAYIDICTGPGRPNAFGKDDEIKRARTAPWIPPELWTTDKEWEDLKNRRTFNGVDGIRDEVEWKKDERVCVTAGGGVGLNAAEKARNNQCILDWFGRSGILDIFDNPRNLTFLQDPKKDPGTRCQPGKRKEAGIDGEDDLLPYKKELRFGKGAKLKKVSAADKDQVTVELEKHNIEPEIRDYWYKYRNGTAQNLKDGYWEFSSDYKENVADKLSPELSPSCIYDLLVIPNGQGSGAVGQPKSFADHLGFEAVEGDDKRMVCLQTKDGRVRILGAACVNYPTYDIGTWTNKSKPTDKPSDKMWTFHATLPVSAVPDGFIITGVNTAAANVFFKDHPNKNVNTMTLEEIQKVVGKDTGGSDDDGKGLAAIIVKERHDNNGYKDLDDLKGVTKSDDKKLEEFEFSYKL